MNKPMTLTEIKRDKWLRDVMCKGFENVFYSYYTNSEEAFFGANSPLPNTIMKYVKEIRTLYELSGAGGSKTAIKDKKSYYMRFEKLIRNMEIDMAKVMNCEYFTIGLMFEENAFAIPLCWDRNLITRVNKKKTFNRELKITLEDIVESKDGFRFKTKDGKHLLISIGLGLFKNMSDEEVVAVVLHEIGHCMQHMLVGINGNVVNVVRKDAIKTLYVCLTPVANLITAVLNVDIYSAILGVVALILSFFVWLHERSIKKLIDEEGEEKAGERIILDMLDSDDWDRNKHSDWLKDMRLDTIKALIRSPKTGIGTKILAAMGYALISLFMIFYYTLVPIMSVFNAPAYMMVLAYNKYLKKERRYEQFADMFTAIYGYGQYQASALAKIAPGPTADLRLFNFLYYVPILNLYYAFGNLADLHTNLLLAGYPSTRERIEAVYTTCEFELNNNTQLSAKDKAELKAQMDDIKDTFDKYVFNLSGPNFIFSLINRITKTTIENSRKTDIEQNVLIPLLETRKELVKQVRKTNPEVLQNKEKKMKFVTALAAFYSAKMNFSWIKNLAKLPQFMGDKLKSEENYGISEAYWSEESAVDMFLEAITKGVEKYNNDLNAKGLEAVSLGDETTMDELGLTYYNETVLKNNKVILEYDMVGSWYNGLNRIGEKEHAEKIKNMPKDERKQYIEDNQLSGKLDDFFYDILDQFIDKNNVPKDEIAKTFYDAIYISEKIKIKYLKIDGIDFRIRKHNAKDLIEKRK